MTEHAWEPQGQGKGVRCKLCGEPAGTDSTGAIRDAYPDLMGPYRTCEEYRQSRRHVFQVASKGGKLWDYECVKCGVVLGYWPDRLEEFQSSVHGAVGDCDKAALVTVREVLEC